jgi:hypothetical protein
LRIAHTADEKSARDDWVATDTIALAKLGCQKDSHRGPDRTLRGLQALSAVRLRSSRGALEPH